MSSQNKNVNYTFRRRSESKEVATIPVENLSQNILDQIKAAEKSR
jgi:hypothetical protein